MGSYIVLCIVLLSHCRTRWLPWHEKLETHKGKVRSRIDELCWYVHKERMRRTSKAFEYSTFKYVLYSVEKGFEVRCQRRCLVKGPQSIGKGLRGSLLLSIVSRMMQQKESAGHFGSSLERTHNRDKLLLCLHHFILLDYLLAWYYCSYANRNTNIVLREGNLLLINWVKTNQELDVLAMLWEV